MGLLISDEKINKAVTEVIENWLDKNNDIILDNNSLTIQGWLNENKEHIFEIIKEESNGGLL